jgi:hypothetical protein
MPHPVVGHRDDLVSGALYGLTRSPLAVLRADRFPFWIGKGLPERRFHGGKALPFAL